MLDVDTIIGKMGPELKTLYLDFAYHSVDDSEATGVHLCTTIRDNCQNLEYLTLSFPLSDNVDEAPRPSVCHQLFMSPNHILSHDTGMLNLKRVEIIGHHSYCEGSSRERVIYASEEVWEKQNQLAWETSSENGSLDHECLHTNIQIHGTPAKRASLLNCRELRGVPSTLPQVSSSDYKSISSLQRSLENVHKSDCRPHVTWFPPPPAEAQESKEETPLELED